MKSMAVTKADHALSKGHYRVLRLLVVAGQRQLACC